MNCMSCIETIARLHLYLDRELSVEEVIHERCTIERAPAHLREAVLRLARLPAGQITSLDPELEMEIWADLEGC